MGKYSEKVEEILTHTGAQKPLRDVVLRAFGELEEMWKTNSRDYLLDTVDETDLTISSGAFQLEFFGWACDNGDIEKSENFKAQCNELLKFTMGRS